MTKKWSCLYALKQIKTGLHYIDIKKDMGI